jgi:hypothetical protein
MGCMRENTFFYNYILLLTMFCTVSISYVQGGAHTEKEKDHGYGYPFMYGPFRERENTLVEISDALGKIENEMNGIKTNDKLSQQERDTQLADLRKRKKAFEEKLESKSTSAHSTKNFIIQSITTSKWDNIRGVDFGDKDLSWSEILSSIKRGVEIQAASSLGRSIGKEIDEGCKSALKPVFSSLKQGCTHLYRAVFKGSKMPFQSQEVMYWSESVTQSLRLLLESSNDIAGYEDRDRQQRHRNLIVRSTSFEGDDATPPFAEAVDNDADTVKGQNALSVHHTSFATMMIYRCVLPQLDKVVEYIVQRRAYYNGNGSTSSVDGQVRDLSAVICHALAVLKEEITKHTTLKDLSSPEFKAVLPHYIRYIDELFRLLAQLVKVPGEPVEKRAADDHQSSYALSSREGYRYTPGYQIHGV